MKINEISEISDVLTKEGINKLTKGQILIFNKGDERFDLKVTKLDKKNGKCWAKRIVTFREDEIVVSGKKGIFGRRKRRTLGEEFR